MLLFDGKPYLMILALATAVYTPTCNRLNYNGLYLWEGKFSGSDRGRSETRVMACLFWGVPGSKIGFFVSCESKNLSCVPAFGRAMAPPAESSVPIGSG